MKTDAPKTALNVTRKLSADAALLVILRPGSQLGLSVCEHYPIRRLALATTQYLHFGEVGVFCYDWLRDRDSQLLGVRFSAFTENNEFFESVRRFDNVAVKEKEISVEIYLSKAGVVEPTLSCDQALAYGEVFRSSGGAYVFAFGCEELQESDWIRLRDLNVEWLQFQVDLGDPNERTLSGLKTKILSTVLTLSLKVDHWFKPSR